MFHNCDKAVRDDSYMNLDTNKIFIESIELLDVKMLFDPLEEHFHSPSMFVNESDLFSRKQQIVGIEDEGPLTLFVIERHPAKNLRILFCCFIYSEPNTLVTYYSNDRVVVV